jgi:ATP-binding cassette subfamily F protein uup
VNLFIGQKSRVGLLGPNGCGKSTLLGILTGTVKPSAGDVLRADDLSVAYFEQDRESLDQIVSLADAICPRGDYVDFRGARLHRHGYLERFLFRPEQMRQPVGSLSGGEQSRLCVARLMLQPADVLVLDEPTNDLDLMTLTVLEEALCDFDGAVILVTHDRYFLDQVATEILAFNTRPEQRGRITPLVGLDQWEAWLSTQRPEKTKTRERSSAPPTRRKKLSFNEQREWDGLEERILLEEAKLAALEAECAQPAVPEQLSSLAEEMKRAREEIDALYARWAELEALVEDPTRLT